MVMISAGLMGRQSFTQHNSDLSATGMMVVDGKHMVGEAPGPEKYLRYLSGRFQAVQQKSVLVPMPPHTLCSLAQKLDVWGEEWASHYRLHIIQPVKLCIEIAQWI